MHNAVLHSKFSVLVNMNSKRIKNKKMYIIWNKTNRSERVKYLDYVRLVLFNQRKKEKEKEKVSRSTIRSKHKTEYRQSKSWYDTSCKWALLQKQKKGACLPVQYHIFNKKRNASSVGFSLQRPQRSWIKCRQSPSTDIQRHCTFILNQRDSFTRGCIAPPCPWKTL